MPFDVVGWWVMFELVGFLGVWKEEVALGLRSLLEDDGAGTSREQLAKRLYSAKIVALDIRTRRELTGRNGNDFDSFRSHVNGGTVGLQYVYSFFAHILLTSSTVNYLLKVF